MFVLSFKNGHNDPTRKSFNKYYMPLVEKKCLNALIDNKPFFDQPVKIKQEAYEKHIEKSRNDDHTTGSLLNFSNHQNYFKLIGTDLSRQANTNVPQQVNFVGKLEEDFGATILLLLKSNIKQI